MADIKDYTIGQSATLTKTFTQEDINKFAELSEDRNPIHIDENYAKDTIFGKTVIHGILQSGLISAVLGNQLPGKGSIYREQSLTFKKPAFPGDTLTAKVEVMEIKERIGLMLLKTTVTNQDGLLLIDGTAKGLIPKAK